MIRPLGWELHAMAVRGAPARVPPRAVRDELPRQIRRRWMISVTVAETAGYLAPASVGVLSAKLGLDGVIQAALITAAGFIEGFALGAGQARALPIAVHRLRYAMLTAIGAALVWLSVMSMMIVARSEAVPPAIRIASMIAVPIVGLTAIGGAQWLELRHHIARAHRWIAWTALAWTLALPLSFAPSPFVDESTPIAAHLALWGCGGLLMAFVMALITWQGVRRLAGAQRDPARGLHARR